MDKQTQKIDALRLSVEETTAWARERFPLVIDIGPDEDFASFAWPVAASGLIARAIRILDTTTTLAEEDRMADAQVSLRVLLELSVVFCWIAIDPATNLLEWRRWDDWRRLKVHRDATRYGIDVLSEERLEKIGDPPTPRSVPELAVAVDRYWSKETRGFRDDGDIRSFRGLYTAVYRRSSTLIHPTQEGMERHLRQTGTGIEVNLEELPAEPEAPVYLALPMMAFMLIVYSHHFGWPSAEVIEAIANTLHPDGAD